MFPLLTLLNNLTIENRINNKAFAGLI